MANEFTKSTKIKAAIVGTIANPDEYNQNIGGQSTESLVCIDDDGEFADGDIGDESLNTIGALINNIKLRTGGLLKFYDAFGVFINNVNLGQATTSLIGQVELLTNAELKAGTDTIRAPTASNILSLFAASLRSSNGYARLPINISGAFVELIVQWGITSNITAATPTAVAFPIAFPNAALQGYVTGSVYSPQGEANHIVSSVTTAAINLTVGGAASQPYRWFAIGY